jgi:hypothetical protein
MTTDIFESFQGGCRRVSQHKTGFANLPVDRIEQGEA